MDYIYQISVDVTSGKVEPERLADDIKTAGLLGLTGISVNYQADELIVTFASALTPTEEALLNATVQATSGDPVPHCSGLCLPTWPTAATLPPNVPPQLIWCVAESAVYVSNGTTWIPL